MSNLLTPKDVADGITALLVVNPLFAGKKLNVFVIANEYAGSFTQKKKSIKQKLILQNAVNNTKEKQSVVESVETKLCVTEYSGHAEKLAMEILDGIVKGDKKDVLNFVVTAGGDGTSLEVQTALFKAAQESKSINDIVKNDVVVLRLPLGTGCDGTDGHSLSETISILENPIHFANARAIKVWYDGKPTKEDFEKAGKNPETYGNVEDVAPWYSFNVAGVGVDAYVCYMTNRMKSKFPGNTYTLWVNMSALLYDREFPAHTANIKLYDESDKLIEEFNQKIEMINFGVSGHRVFGGGKKVLPGDTNFAIINKVSAIELVMKNPSLTKGTYEKTGIGKTYTAKKVVLNYDAPVLTELDGETHLLIKESFPLTMELTEPCIQILESDSLEWDRGTVRK